MEIFGSCGTEIVHDYPEKYSRISLPFREYPAIFIFNERRSLHHTEPHMRNAVEITDGRVTVGLVKDNGRWRFVSSGYRITRAALRVIGFRVVRRFHHEVA